MQRILLNPKEWASGMKTIIRVSCDFSSIRTIVVVGSCFAPPQRTGSFDIDQDFAPAANDDWRRVICKSPTEINLGPLLDAIQNGRQENEAHLAEYRMVLTQDVDMLPVSLPPPLRLFDHCSWRFRYWIDIMRDCCVESMAPHPPGLFLRTREELRNPSTVNSLWAGRVSP
jgi:hypothetical protein